LRALRICTLRRGHGSAVIAGSARRSRAGRPIPAAPRFEHHRRWRPGAATATGWHVLWTFTERSDATSLKATVPIRDARRRLVGKVHVTCQTEPTARPPAPL